MRKKFFNISEAGDVGEPLHELVATGPQFISQFSGWCAVDRFHKVKRGDRVTKVMWADNPTIPVSGVACKSCTKILPKDVL